MMWRICLAECVVHNYNTILKSDFRVLISETRLHVEFNLALKHVLCNPYASFKNIYKSYYRFITNTFDK